jgi:hypothetical protein
VVIKKLQHMSKKTKALNMDVLGNSGTDTPKDMEENIEIQD